MQERIIILSWYMTFSSEIPSLLTSRSKRRVVLKRFREQSGIIPTLIVFSKHEHCHASHCSLEITELLV